MFSNRVALIALGIACVTAAAGGGYLATRLNVADRTVAPIAAENTHADAAVPSQPEQPAEATQGMVREAQKPVPAQPGQTATRRVDTGTTLQRNVATRQPAPSARPALSPSASRSEAPATPPERTWSGPATSTATVPEAAPAARADERTVEPPQTIEPTQPTFDELTIAADSVVGLQAETTLSSESAHIEDRVDAHVVRDVRVDGRLAIPAGTRAIGSVVSVERGGRMRDRARLGVRFHTLALADGTRLPITTETIYRYGNAPGNSSAAKIGGGAVAGAILGAIIGGGKGAAIGATTGAAGGGAAVMTSDRSEAVFPSGAEVTARFLSPVTVTVDR